MNVTIIPLFFSLTNNPTKSKLTVLSCSDRSAAVVRFNYIVVDESDLLLCRKLLSLNEIYSPITSNDEQGSKNFFKKVPRFRLIALPINKLLPMIHCGLITSHTRIIL